MYKPKSLREHLIAAKPDLQRNPDKLLVFADEDNVVATGTGSLSFLYQYKLNAIITGYSGDPDAIMAPLLAWVAVHQVGLLGNPEQRKTSIGFEVDFNNYETMDLAITLALNAPTVQPPLLYFDKFYSIRDISRP
ncbi:Phage tail protein [Collimonas arenae]|uniref:Phage tail protein n=1 Tax=Collimonas arenae TaxID=279058 RepID=A0A0A1FI28_9BURK|nr:phage tail protein [Collimonas arenae]AIY42552.1 Phage tail protein [Collimonas arenae]